MGEVNGNGRRDNLLSDRWIRAMVGAGMLGLLSFVGIGLKVWYDISKNFVSRELYEVRSNAREDQLRRMQAAVERIERKVDDQSLASRMTRVEVLLENLGTQISELRKGK